MRRRQQRRGFGGHNGGGSSGLLFLIFAAAVIAIIIFRAPIMDALLPDRADSQIAYGYETIQTHNITEAHVTRVIDGDTIELADGRRVRLIGIDAPEIGEAGADEATQFVSDLILDQTVWLEPDGDDTDRFGRLRRYVWVQEPVDPTDEHEIKAYMLNALLLEHGLAEVMIFGTPRVEELFTLLCTSNSAENEETES